MQRLFHKLTPKQREKEEQRTRKAHAYSKKLILSLEKSGRDRAYQIFGDVVLVSCSVGILARKKHTKCDD